jgi:thiol-disulfide isomerase/thioredoxin/protocatechuate 3,4-dioxygenase beta subunit
VRASPDAPEEVMAEARRIAAALGCRRAVAVRSSRQFAVPFVCGLLRPVVVLPERMGKPAHRPQLTGVLAHELAHVRSRDWGWSAGLQVVSILLWFHPLVWRIGSAHRVACDVVCDAVSASHLGDVQAYCRTLAGVALEAAASLAAGALPMARVCDVRRRIAALGRKVFMTPLKPRAVAGVALGGLLSLALFAGVRFALAEPAPRESEDQAAGRSPQSAVPADKARPSMTGARAPADAAATEKAPAATVRGQVLGPGGRPAAGAAVSLRHRPESEAEYLSTTADSHGHFRFAGVAPGMIAVYARAPAMSWGCVEYTVQPGQPAADLKFTLTRPVEWALRTVGPDGKPVAGVELEYLGWRSGQSDQAWLPVAIWRMQKVAIPTSDPKGLLRIAGLPEGATFSGRVKHPQFARAYFAGIVPGEKPHNLKLEAGYPITVLAVERVTQRPAPGATVTLTASPREVSIFDEPVGPDGKLVIRLGLAKSVGIHVRHPQLMATEWYHIDTWGDAPSDITFKAELARRAKITGRVLEEGTGKPAAGAVVALLVSSNQALTTRVADGSGRYEITGPEGYIGLKVLDGNGYWVPYQGGGTGVRSRAESVTEAPDLKARRLPRIRGTVLLPDGKPAAQTLVQLGPFYRDPVLTDAAGRYEITSEHGSCYVIARHCTQRLSGVGAIGFDEILAGKPCTIRLGPESTVRGQVLGPDGKLRAGVRVGFTYWYRIPPSAQWGTRLSAVTDERGEYQFCGLIRDSEGFAYPDSGNGFPDKREPRTGTVRLSDEVVTVKPLKLTEEFSATANRTRGPREMAGQLAPPWSCQAWVNSPPLQLESLRGKIVLLDFWATWCGPCVAELPLVQAAHGIFTGQGVVVIGLHHNSVPPPEVEAFVRQKKFTFPIGLDTAAGETIGRYRVTGLPTTLLIDRAGRIVDPEGDFLGKLRELVLYDGAPGQR